MKPEIRLFISFMVVEPIQHRNITALVLRGHGKLTVSADGSLKGVTSVKRRGDTLECTAGGVVGITITHGDGSNSIRVNNICADGGLNMGRNILYGDTIVTIWFGDVLFTSLFGGPTICVGHIAPGTSITVDGKTITADEPRFTELHRLLDSKLQHVSLLDSGDIVLACGEPLATDFEVKLQGSGVIKLPEQMFARLCVRLSGSGDVIGPARAAVLHATLSGLGNIKRLHVMDCAELAVTGSGNIRVSAEPEADVTRSRTGPGSIKVNRVATAPVPKRARLFGSTMDLASDSVDPVPESKNPPSASIQLPEPYADEPPAQEGEAECSICLDRAVRTCIVPCGHCALCVTCARQDSLTRCPLCQTAITSIVRTYSS